MKRTVLGLGLGLVLLAAILATVLRRRGEGFQDAAAPPADGIIKVAAPAAQPMAPAAPPAPPAPATEMPAAAPAPAAPATPPPPPKTFTYSALPAQLMGLKDQFDTLQKLFLMDMSIPNLKSLEETQTAIVAAHDPLDKNQAMLVQITMNTIREDKAGMRRALGAPEEGFKEYTGNPYNAPSPNTYQAMQFKLGSNAPRQF